MAKQQQSNGKTTAKQNIIMIDEARNKMKDLGRKIKTVEKIGLLAKAILAMAIGVIFMMLSIYVFKNNLTSYPIPIGIACILISVVSVPGGIAMIVKLFRNKT
ncbi:MAG: hypothetical protein RRY78_00640 [Clostridia bacterium]